MVFQVLPGSSRSQIADVYPPCYPDWALQALAIQFVGKLLCSNTEESCAISAATLGEFLCKLLKRTLAAMPPSMGAAKDLLVGSSVSLSRFWPLPPRPRLDLAPVPPAEIYK